MLNLEFIRMAWGSIVGHKLRSALTLLGIVVGVFAIISSVTAVQVIDLYFSDTINFLGSTTFTVQKWPGIQLGNVDESVRNRPDITYEEIVRLKRRARLAVAVSPSEDFKVTRVRYGSEETDPNVMLYGVDEQWLVNNSYEMASGRFLTDQDVQYARPVVVIGSTVATNVFPTENPLGKEIKVDGRRYQVVGVMAEKGQAFGSDQDNVVVASITRLLALYGEQNRSLSFDVRAPSVELLSATMDETIGLFRTIRKVDAGKDNNFEVITNDSLVKTFTSFTDYLTLGGAGIGLVALLAAGIGVMNIMLVSVTERTREIGIRRAVGATRRSILRQFLLEAIFLCQIGGLIGILFGALAGNILALAGGLRPAFPWGWALWGVFGLTIIAVVFGSYPAWKAARLNPIESLRYE